MFDRRWVGAALALACALGGGVAAAQDRAAEDAQEARIRRLEEELERLKADHDAERKAREDAAARAAAPAQDRPAPPEGGAAPREDAPWLDEKFTKKWGDRAVASWKDGFSLYYLDDAATGAERVLHRISLNGRLQTDARFFEPDEDFDHPQRDRFFLRRARMSVGGTLYRYFDFLVEIEFGQSDIEPKDAYLNVGFVKFLQLRAGQFKEPFGLEHLQSSRFLHFIERNMLQGVAAVDFDMGAMLWGDLGFLSYYLAVQNGTSTNNPDNNDDKDVGGRLVFHPFRDESGSVFRHLLLGGSYTYGRQTNFFGTYRTPGVSGGTNPSGAASEFFTYREEDGGFADDLEQRGDRHRWGVELRWNIAPITVQAEYGQVLIEGIERAGNAENVRTQGAYVDVLWMITGEENPFSKAVRPKDDFNPFEGGWGAWEVGVRWDWLHVDRDAVRELGARGANTVNALVAGLNWYWNPNVKLQVNYNRNWFNEDAANTGEDTEDVLLFRLSMYF